MTIRFYDHPRLRHRGRQDLSVLIATERGVLAIADALAAYAGDPVGIASINPFERLHGVHRATTAAQRQRREAFVGRLMAVLPAFPFDLVAARLHASLWANLAAKGVTVGSHDLLIGATAIALGYRVATRDRRSFAEIPGLELVVL